MRGTRQIIPSLLLGCSLAFSMSAAVAQAPIQLCNELIGMTIRANKIGNPTTGAIVDTAMLVDAAGRQPEYCRVQGRIFSVDPQAPNINFAVGLPTDWNQKSIHLGGGGYDGTLRQPTDQPRMTAVTTPAPMMRGYATYGSDGGHQGSSTEFALNDEAFYNYGRGEQKKTHDVAVAVIKARYGSAPKRSYFIGFSEGGREALIAAQHYPQDYDGVISVAPLTSVIVEEIANVVMFQEHYQPGGLMTNAKMATLKAAIVATCDTLDGVADSLVSAPHLCRFDPNAIRCPGGADTGDSCLSDGQIRTVNAIGSRVDLGFKIANRVDSYEGYNILKGANINFGTRAVPTVPPVFGPDPGLWVFGDLGVRWFIVRDGTADLRNYDPLDYKERTKEVSRIADATNPNLNAFWKRGGKLIIAHGTYDQLVATDNTSKYFKTVVDRLGQKKVNDFIRYYEIGGYAHNIGGNTAGDFPAVWDDITALERWVEHGEAPNKPVAYHLDGTTIVRSRPLCRYGSYPRYVGGDVNDAASFQCTSYQFPDDRPGQSVTGND